MVDFSLEGKVALVTGGTYGIGFAIAKALAEAGAKIAFNARHRDGIDKAVADYKALGIEAYGYVCDVTDERQVQELVAKVTEEVGHVNILVNNAGIIKRIPICEMSAEEFRQAADYAITDCGTGEGAMLAMNSFPGIICGHVEDPVDAYTFAHVNDGNAVAIPFAKGFGWGGELNLEYIFEKLFGFGHGQGYPKERVEPEMRNKKILDGVKAVSYRPLVDILKDLDGDLVRGAFAGKHFKELFLENAEDGNVTDFVKTLI